MLLAQIRSIITCEIRKTGQGTYIESFDTYNQPLYCNIKFPRLWEIARICPIPKVDEPLSDVDYRPVSTLPTLSKGVRALGAQPAHSLHQQGNASRSYSIRIPERSFSNYCFTGDPRRSNTGIKQRGGNTDGLRRLEQGFWYRPI